MSAKKQEQQIKINDLKLTINRKGEVVWDDELQLSGKELDLIADISRGYAALEKLSNKLPSETRGGCEIRPDDNGEVSIGCQSISAADVARVHKISLAMRRR